MTTTAEKLAPRLARPIFDFTIPDEARQWETDPHSFSMQQLTTLQDIDAAQAAGGDMGIKLLVERIDRSVVMVDGQPRNQAAPLMDNWSPQARDFAAIAFNQMVAIKPEHRTAFLGSMKKRVE